MERVVLPVPDSPKKIATRPSPPTLAEQCIDSTPRWGRRSFIRVKIDFLISPAYWVPPIRISWSVRCRITKLAGARAVGGGVGGEAGGVEHERLGAVGLELLVGGLDEEGAGEEGVPGALGDDPERQPVGGVGARPGVDHVEVAGAQVGAQALAERGVDGGVDRLVDRAPPDAVLAARLPDEVLVLGRPPGVRAGRDHERAALGELRVAGRQRPLVERGHREVPPHRGTGARCRGRRAPPPRRAPPSSRSPPLAP